MTNNEAAMVIEYKAAIRVILSISAKLAGTSRSYSIKIKRGSQKRYLLMHSLLE